MDGPIQLVFVGLFYWKRESGLCYLFLCLSLSAMLFLSGLVGNSLQNSPFVEMRALGVYMALFILGLFGLTVCDTALKDNPVPASPVPVPSAASA